MNLFELFVKIGVDDEASDKIDKISDNIGKGLKKAASIGASAVVGLGTMAVKTFADFEQLTGGAELMFGEAFGTVQKNAQEAYKTVQMSQNEYLQQVNGFATGLKTALGGNEQAAAELSHRIIKAEADIIAATGNTAENVQNAFNGIMKSNFTMLDNLQIGITPTKEGFQEVIDKVNEWNKANGNATKYQMGNLADMQSALVDYIEMVGMSGYAQNEAAGTILGSFSAMKAAASNFATSLVTDNGDVKGSFDALKETAITFFDNVKPRVLAFLEAISPIATVVAGITSAFVAFQTAATISSLLSTLIKSWQAYKVANEGATIAQWALNAAMNANPITLIVPLVAGLVGALITLWHTNDDFRNALITAWGQIKETAVNVWSSIVKFFTEDIPNAFNTVITFVKNNWKDLLLFITNPIARAIKLLYNLNPKFKKWADDLLGRIKGWLSGIKDVGRNLLEGLWNGIADKVQWLKNKVSGVVDKIKGWFTGKDGFDTHSPSKWSEKVFKYVMDGSGNGIDDGTPALMRKVNNVTDLVKNGFDFGTAKVNFASSAAGISSAGIVNGVSSGIRSIGGNLSVNMLLPDGRIIATQYINDFLRVAEQNGTPIANPIS